MDSSLFIYRSEEDEPTTSGQLQIKVPNSVVEGSASVKAFVYGLFFKIVKKLFNYLFDILDVCKNNLM